MKHCIYSDCNAELDDYQKRCPNCGRLQSHDVLSADIQDENGNKTITVTRHGFITFWLWLLLVSNAIMSIVSLLPKTMFGSNCTDVFVISSVISGVFGIINVVGTIMLLSWKRVGFYIIALSAAIGNITVMIMTGTFPIGLIGIVILWFILKIKSDGISYWEAMRMIK